MKARLSLSILLFIVLSTGIFAAEVTGLENNTISTNLCQYASSASATSENIFGSIADYAVGPPDGSNTGVCTDWSGPGYTWAPTNWNVKANLTLNYDNPIYVDNFTVFGDYDVCWDRAWLKNSSTGQILQVLNGYNNACSLTIQSTANFIADSIILETCGWAWSSTDSVLMCGLSTLNESICGNSILEANEECDDGNTMAGDGCNQTCQIEINISVCGNSIIETDEECDDGNTADGDGCTADCLFEVSDIIYVAPYLGDIDGSLKSTWTPFYGQLADFYETNEIPVGISVFPATIITSNPFRDAFLKMYSSDYMELVQKGFAGSELEANMDLLSYPEQRAIIASGQNYFRQIITEMTGNSAVELPLSYNQMHGRFTETTRDAAESLGLKMYFDMFLEGDLAPAPTKNTFDIIQYGVGFSIAGNPGYTSVYDTPDNLIRRIKEFNLASAFVLRINGSPVIPIWAHQEDFMSAALDDTVNLTKWNIYTETILRLKNDSKIVLVSPSQIYALRHTTFCGNSVIEAGEGCDDGNILPGDGCSPACKLESINICGNGLLESEEECDDGNLINGDGCSLDCTYEAGSDTICKFASTASATSENSPGSAALLATGAPDAPSSGCSVWSGFGYSWTPANWNIKANLTLNYDTPIYMDNFTIFGDYDACWDRAWLRDSSTGNEMQVLNGLENSCALTTQSSANFRADSVVIETCGWSWSATDAVQMCGKPSQAQQYYLPDVSICDWKNCKKGAVSVSVDDYFTSCMPQLESNGYRGTFFLTNTETYPQDLWDQFRDAFNKGHELGTHTETHYCDSAETSKFIVDMNANINGIISNTNASTNDIISHAYPCGFIEPNIQSTIESNWNFISARGYYSNQLESSTPSNFYNLKNYNSKNFEEEIWNPPSYFEGLTQAEQEGQWLVMVFHNRCNDDGALSTLPTRNLWIDTVGNVAKYIKLRDNAQISNYQTSAGEISFSVNSNLTDSIYMQNLTLKVAADAQPLYVNVNGQPVQFSWSNEGFVLFNMPFPAQGEVVIGM